METTDFNRRGFIQGTTGALFFLAGLGGRRADGAELVYDMGHKFPLTKIPAPTDQVRMMAGYLETYESPKGTMDARGGWTAVYDILKFESTPGYKQSSKTLMYNTVLGQVAIAKRSASPDYEVQMSYRPTQSEESVTARIACSDSPIAALKGWDLEWDCRGKGTELSYTNREQGAVGTDHFSVTSRGNTDRFESKQPLACLWTLMDAVRWLPATTGWSRGFDMYMDLSSLRRNQSLSFAGRGQVALAAGMQELNFYEQRGEGIEPIHYAVDGQRRTIFVTQGQLGWGLNRIEEV
ncbi:MAG: hypothetical protein K9M54_12385 [Kiritimatiellales bacterium]|nr:hypothetical protein [Kiritimatiellales bacterium]